MKNITLIIGLILLTNYTFSQVTLPYSTGFDNASEQNGWIEFKKAATTFSHWNISTSSNSNSAPNSLSHDYSPSSGITLTDNWFVSPAFEIDNGGTLDQISYMFSGFSTPSTNDTIAIYLLQGSQDPDIATQVLLFDFRNSEYVADNTYRTKTNIDLPSFNGLSYFAIRYKNSDCSSNWLTVNFDDITISSGTVNIDDNQFISNKIKIYPNPVKDIIKMKFTDINIKKIELIAINGKLIKSYHSNFNELKIYNIIKGTYILKIETEKGVLNKKILAE
jgi:hypothetical protein